MEQWNNSMNRRRFCKLTSKGNNMESWRDNLVKTIIYCIYCRAIVLQYLILHVHSNILICLSLLRGTSWSEMYSICNKINLRSEKSVTMNSSTYSQLWGQLQGDLSDTFNLHRGIRQGCQISNLIIIIAIEILGIGIRSSRNISDLNIGKK